jgi:hypothetical protein
MNGYMCYHRSKTRPLEITTAGTSLEAQNAAGLVWNLKPSKWCEITVVLVEKEGEPVIHSTSEVG